MTLYPDPLDPSLNNPHDAAWEAGGRIHNWQNYIGERTRDIWRSFDDAQKLALAGDADDRAGNENWD